MVKGTEEVNENIHLSDLVEMNNPQRVIGEVKIIVSINNPEFDFRPLYKVFYDIVRLFNGDYPGYRKCNTGYHDLKHTLDIFLATVRLFHGYLINGNSLSESKIISGLISALMHDTGYIQTIEDTSGTGAKYTLEHISRSKLFMEKYFKKHNFSKDDMKFCKNCISCTSINTDIKEIPFPSHDEETVGKIIGTAHLLGKMADRNYLEKLLFLYHEFMEGNVLGYENELDLLKKTLGFYISSREMIFTDFGNLNRNMIHHFKERWNLDRDLYNESIEKNIDYLKFLLENHENDYRNHLRRGYVMEEIHQKG